VHFREIAGGDKLPSNPTLNIPAKTMKQWCDFMHEQLSKCKDSQRMIDFTGQDFKDFLAKTPAKKSISRRVPSDPT
jgi:hypothetical protein